MAKYPRRGVGIVARTLFVPKEPGAGMQEHSLEVCVYLYDGLGAKYYHSTSNKVQSTGTM